MLLLWIFKFLFQTRGHTEYITCAALHDIYVYTGSADATIRKWNIATCECDFIYKGHTGKIHK